MWKCENMQNVTFLVMKLIEIWYSPKHASVLFFRVIHPEFSLSKCVIVLDNLLVFNLGARAAYKRCLRQIKR